MLYASVLQAFLHVAPVLSTNRNTRESCSLFDESAAHQHKKKRT